MTNDVQRDIRKLIIDSAPFAQIQASFAVGRVEVRGSRVTCGKWGLVGAPAAEGGGAGNGHRVEYVADDDLLHEVAPGRAKVEG